MGLGGCYCLRPKGLHHAETAQKAKELDGHLCLKAEKHNHLFASHDLSEHPCGTSYPNLFVLPVYRFLQVKHLSGEGI